MPEGRNQDGSCLPLCPGWDAAAIALVDSNVRREKTLPSEKAFAYKLKLNDIRNRTDHLMRSKVVHSLIESPSDL